MSDHENRELSAKEVQLIGEILLPKFTEALRIEFFNVRHDFTNALAVQSVELNGKIDHLEARVGKLETMAWRAMLGYGGIVAAITIAWHLAKGWVFKRMGWGQ